MKKFFKSPWTISIGSVLLSFLLTIGYDGIKGIQIFSTIGTIIKAILSAVHAFLTFNLKVWWLLLGLAFIFIILLIIAKYKEKRKPKFLNYTEDNFNGFKWTWYWEYDKLYGLWQLNALKPHCPDCDTPMYLDDSYMRFFKCPRCQQTKQIKKQEHEIEKVIKDNIRRRKEL